MVAAQTRTKMSPGFDGKTEDTIDAAMNATQP